MKSNRILIVLPALLFSTGVYAQDPDKPDKEMGKVKEEIALLLQKRTTIYDKINDVRDKPKEVLVQDDKIEFMLKNTRSIINFSDLIDYPIGSKENKVMNDDGSVRRYYYNLELGNFIFLYGNDPKAAEAIDKDLLFIQQQFRKKPLAHSSFFLNQLHYSIAH